MRSERQIEWYKSRYEGVSWTEWGEGHSGGGKHIKSVKDMGEGGPLARHSVALRPKIAEVGSGK